MRSTRLLIVFLLLAFAALPPLHAQDQAVASSPYSVTVPVTDTTDVQRDQAFTTALTQVLTRLAGGQDLRSNPGYGDALKNAAALVQKFQYAQASSGGGLELNVSFEPGTVRRLVAKLGVASAGIKPPVLLLVRGTDGKLLDQAALAPLAASANGASVTYPQGGDLPDAGKIAAADPAALAAIDQQYHTGLVLLGSLHGNSANWTLVSGGQVQRWSGQGSTEDALMTAGGSGLASRLGKQLNVIGAGVSNGKLWVDGLQSAMDYANLLATLRADPAVQSVSTEGAQDDGVMLDLQTSIPLTALAANLTAGGKLIAAKSPHDGADATLHWLH